MSSYLGFDNLCTAFAQLLKDNPQLLTELEAISYDGDRPHTLTQAINDPTGEGNSAVPIILVARNYYNINPIYIPYATEVAITDADLISALGYQVDAIYGRYILTISHYEEAANASQPIITEQYITSAEVGGTESITANTTNYGYSTLANELTGLHTQFGIPLPNKNTAVTDACYYNYLYANVSCMDMSKLQNLSVIDGTLISDMQTKVFSGALFFWGYNVCFKDTLGGERSITTNYSEIISGELTPETVELGSGETCDILTDSDSTNNKLITKVVGKDTGACGYLAGSTVWQDIFRADDDTASATASSFWATLTRYPDSWFAGLKPTTIRRLFVQNTALKKLPEIDLSECSEITSLCYGCTALTEVELDIPAVTTMTTAFYGCNALTSVILHNTETVSTTNNAFAGCTSLQSLQMHGFCDGISDSNTVTRLTLADCPLTYAGLTALANSLGTPTGTAQRIEISSASYNLLDETLTALFTDKNWTVEPPLS